MSHVSDITALGEKNNFAHKTIVSEDRISIRRLISPLKFWKCVQAHSYFSYEWLQPYSALNDTPHNRTINQTKKKVRATAKSLAQSGQGYKVYQPQGISTSRISYKLSSGIIEMWLQSFTVTIFFSFYIYSYKILVFLFRPIVNIWLMFLT